MPRPKKRFITGQMTPVAFRPPLNRTSTSVETELTHHTWGFDAGMVCVPLPPSLSPMICANPADDGTPLCLLASQICSPGSSPVRVLLGDHRQSGSGLTHAFAVLSFASLRARVARTHVALPAVYADDLAHDVHFWIHRKTAWVMIRTEHHRQHGVHNRMYRPH